MHYITNGSRFARYTDHDTLEVWDDQEGWTFPVPADIAKYGPDWHLCDDPGLVKEP